MHKLPYAILFAGAVLRMVGLAVSPIWYDEAYTIYLARLPDMMIRLEFSDFNPPLWQIIVYPFIAILGENEIAVRLPSLIASLAAMWLAWQIAVDLVFPRWPKDSIKVAVAVMISLLPYLLWLAQDGRCYSVMSLIYVAVMYFAIKGRWMAWGACMGLLLYIHTVGVFYAAAAGLGALLWKWEDRKKIIIWAAVAGLAYLPWVPSLLVKAKDHWLGQLTDNSLLTALYASFFAGDLPSGIDMVSALLVALSLVVAVLVSAQRLDQRDHMALTVWAAGPLLLMMAGALLKNVIFYRPLSAMILPTGIWLAASLMPGDASPKIWQRAMVTAWVVVLAISLVSWNPSLKGGELRQVAQLINNQWQPGDVVYHATGTTWLPFSLYLNEPGWLLDEEQHDGLLQTHLQNEFGIPRAGLETIEHQRAWVIVPGDPLMSERAIRRMDRYTQSGVLVGMVHYWQAADIQIYLVEEK